MEKQRKIELGREKLVEYQKRKSPRSASKKSGTTKEEEKESEENSENSQSDFSFSVSVTPPLLPEHTSTEKPEESKLKIKSDDEIEEEIKSISEELEIEESNNSENDRSLHEIVLPEIATVPENLPTTEKCDTASKKSTTEDSVDNSALIRGTADGDEVLSEKRRKVQDVVDDILRSEHFDDINMNDFTSVTLEQSCSKIKDLQVLLSSKDDIIKVLTSELEGLRAQYDNLSTFSSNTSTTEYKNLAEEYLLKKDVEAIKKELEVKKQKEVEAIKVNYEDKVEDVMKNNDAVLKTLEIKYVEEINSLKNEVASLKAENSALNKNKSASASTSEEEFNEVVLSYERRLHDQIELAKHDLYAALELQIQKLLENNGEEIDCPGEFLQLRQMFTKKFDLEIKNLKEEHASEIAKLKEDHERFIIRSAERQNRRSLDLETEKLIEDRNNFKKMNDLLRQVVSELISYFSKCEDEINNTVVDELLKDDFLNQLDDSALMGNIHSMAAAAGDSNYLNESTFKQKRVHFTPNVSNIITILGTDTLLSSYELPNDLSQDLQNELQRCLDRLKNDAAELLVTTSNFKRNRSFVMMANVENKSLSLEANKNPEFESSRGGLDSKRNSLENDRKSIESLREKLSKELDTNGKLNEQLKQTNQLVQNLELERANLESQLTDLIEKQNSLENELEMARRKIVDLISENGRKEIVSEGYGQSGLQTLTVLESPRESFTQALERARIILDEEGEGTDHTEMLAMIDSLCRAGLRAMEDTRKESHDLQLQVILQLIQSICCQKVDSADKKLRDTVQFLELQATEREAERDETQRQLNLFQAQLNQRERECAATQQIAQEIERLEQRMREMTQMMEESDQKKQETEKELKEAVDKVWVLRDIIRDLESQLEVRTESELKLQTQVEDLQNIIKQQHRNNEQLVQELDSLKSLPENQQLIDHADHLEKELAEFKKFASIESLQQINIQIEEMEAIMYKKTKDLECLHANTQTTTCGSPSEDVSTTELVKGKHGGHLTTIESLDILRRLHNAIDKHSRVESAAVKKIKDLEMQMSKLNQKYQDLQVERDVLQDRLSDQLTEISTLQMRLDEQRHLVQTITKQSNMSLENEIFELKNENRDLTERLNSQEKQLKHLNNILDKTTKQLKETEKELSSITSKSKEAGRHFRNEIKHLSEENKHLKDKIEKDSESRKAFPELVETILADRNAEVEILRSELIQKEKVLEQLSQSLKDQNDSKNSARTLSDVVSISEYDEVDILRKNETSQHSNIQHSLENILKISVDKSQEANIQPHSSGINISEIPNILHSEHSSKSLNKLDVSETHPEIAKLQSQLTLKQKELDDFKVILHNLEVKYEANVNQSDQMKSELDRIREELQLKVDQSEKVNKDLENKVRQCNSLEEKLNEQNVLINSLQDQIQENEKEISEKTDELKAALKKSNEFKDTVADRECEIEILNEDINKFQEEISSLQTQVRDSQSAYENFLHTDNKLSKQLKEKDTQLLKKESEINELQNEIVHLQDYLKEKDKIIHQITEDSNSLKEALESIQNKMKESGNIIDLMKKLKEEQQLTAQLQEEVDNLKTEIERLEGGGSPRMREFSEIEEISGEVQQQLNYSAQLDTNILNAIENSKAISESTPKTSPKREQRLQKVENFNIEVPPNLETEVARLQSEKNSLTEDLKSINSCNQELVYLRDSLIGELDEVRKQLNLEKDNCVRLQKLLDEEKAISTEIQMQDANIIEQMRIRLETALDNEIELEKTIEREKTLRAELGEKLQQLQEKLEVAMKTMENKHNTEELLKEISQLKKTNDEIHSVLTEKDNEIALWKAKYSALNEDFENLKKSNSDSMQQLEGLHKMDQIIAENVQLKIEKTELKNRLSDLLAQVNRTKQLAKVDKEELQKIEQEHEMLIESKMSALQREKDMKLDQAKRIVELEQENKLISLQVIELKRDLKLSRDQENRLTELLAKEREQQLHSPVPAKFLEKLNDLKLLLDTHVKENRQMSETLQKLTNERHLLQERVKQLEGQQAKMHVELENDVKFSTLFARFLRVESYRKALAWQKQYLLAIVYSYEQGKTNCLLLPPAISVARSKKRKKPSFRIISVMLVCIFRMKFMVRRWSTGVRLNARSWHSRRHMDSSNQAEVVRETVELSQVPSHFQHLDQNQSSPNHRTVLSSRFGTYTTPKHTTMKSWSGTSPPCHDTSRINIQRYSQSPLQAPPLIAQYMERYDQIQQRLGLLQQIPPPPP